MPISKSELFLFYKRKLIQQAIVEHSKNKEVVGSYDNKGFSKRPDIIQYPAEILEAVKQGISSFHCSEELWKDPFQLSSTLNRKQLDELRKAWDLVLDIDCQELEYSKIAALLLVEALKYHNINATSIKFSGNHGFHIGIPFESFPKTMNIKGEIIETRLLFPETPRQVAKYLKHMIKEHLKNKILEFDKNIENIAKRFNKTTKEIGGDNFDPFLVLEVDTILISSRHLYRAPYSFNEKSGLVSIPIDPNKILEFNKQQAISKNVIVDTNFKFLDREKCKENEAKQLFIQAYDLEMEEIEKQKYKQIQDTENKKYKKDFEVFQEAVPEQYFPPCIKKILEGLRDGKKRALFILINFLKSVNWPYDEIEERIKQWNKVNKETLKENYIVGQLRYQKHNKEKILPPNCKNIMYYKDLGICLPDNLCAKIKNPVNYAIIKTKSVSRQQNQQSGRRKATEQEKEQRRKIRQEEKKFKEEMLKKNKKD
tara:strand:- start:862 stop:2310 length:1449 start_codon:yes stop_codon:yes gene_type:complete